MVTLVDSSAWIEYLRGTGGPAHRRMAELARSGAELATTEPVVMEILAGARTAHEFTRLREAMLATHMLPVSGLDDYEQAAAIHRACRTGGETVRGLIDCLVAAVAIRTDSSLLHADIDFEVIARHTPLRLEPVA
jgi:predicted nucleic acid-binding protein